MGRFKTKSDYEEIRNARIVENQARLASLGLQKTLLELRSLNSSPKSDKIHKRKWCRVDRSADPLRRSARLSGKSPPLESGAKFDYEELRNARIVENLARLANLGLQKTLLELRFLNSSPKSDKIPKRKWCRVDRSADPLRRSARLSGKSPPLESGAKFDYEELRNARIVENLARLANLGLQKTLLELRFLNSSPKSDKIPKRKWCRVDRSADPLRRSARLSGKSPPLESGAKFDYEELRNARIVENQARLASLGLQKTLMELRSLNSSPKSDKIRIRKYCRVDRSAVPLRRSVRLSGNLLALLPSSEGVKLSYSEGGSGGESGGAKRGLRRSKISKEALRWRCKSKGRGSLYDPVHGICCHFCRQKKLCGEEDCKRCGDLDMDQPCLGKTECSVCHSTNGILCRACLKVRYGEEMEEVRMNKEWMCPHCIEERGINPYWICNSSFCLKKRKMVPTGIAIYKAREMGYKSVAHLLMAELSKRRCLYIPHVK